MTQAIARIYLFGPIRITIGEETSLLTGKAGELMGYLALQPHAAYSATRSRVAGSLWPFYDEGRARQLLSNSVYRLQKQFPALSDRLMLTADTVGLRSVWVDVIEFESLTDSADLTGLKAGLDLYTGPLLEEIDGEWVTSRRTLLHERYLATLAQVCSRFEGLASNALYAALPLARRWVEADPLNEEAHAALIRFYVQVGNRSAARQQYERMRHLFKSELDIEPTIAPPEPSPTVDQTEIEAEEKRFVGRRKERSLLLSKIEQLSKKKGGIVFIEGEAGIGKSALLQEVKQSADWQLASVGWGTAAETAQSPFEPLSDGLGELAARPLYRQTLDQLSSPLRQLIDPMVKQPAARLSKKPPASSLFTADMPLAAGLQHLLTAWLNAGPILLLLDDMQWADPQVWVLLPALAELAEKHPLLVVIAYRDWPVRQNKAAWEMIEQVNRQHKPLRLVLDGLSPAEVDDFLASYRPDQADQSLQFHQMSGGNPLLLHELIRQGVPDSAELISILAQRLKQLESVEKEALLAASMLGREVDFIYWSTLLEQPLTGPLLRRLVSSRFLVENEGGYQFQHDLVRLHLYQQIESDQKRAWHAALARLMQADERSLAAVAWHQAEAGALGESIASYRRAAEQALLLRAEARARHLLQEASALVTKAELSERETLPLKWLQIKLAHQQAPSSELLPEIEAASALARAHADDETLLRLHLLAYDLAVGQGDQSRLSRLTEEIMTLVEGIGMPELEIEALQQLALKNAFALGDAERGMAYADSSRQIANRIARKPELLAESLLIEVSCLLRGRRAEEAVERLNEVKVILDGHQSLQHIESDWTYMWAVAAQFTGDWETSHSMHEAYLSLQRRSGNFYATTTALYNTANSASAQGMHARGILYATEMVTLAEEQLARDDFQKRLQYRTLLALCHIRAEDFEGAKQALEPLMDQLQEADDSWAVAFAWQMVGEMEVGLDNRAAGYKALKRAVDLGQGLSSMSASPFLALAELCVETDRREEGAAALQEASTRINLDGPSMQSHTYYHYLRYRFSGDVSALERAYGGMVEQSKRFTDPQARQRYLDGFGLHREIMAARAGMLPPPFLVELARRDVSMGRPLEAGEKVRVTWTVDDGPGDEAILKEKGRAAMRQRRVLRLMEEAWEQGAAPTYKDIANALGVSVRTIERDAHKLQQAGHRLYSRRHPGVN
ncbi:MAG: AAA family ATPase [Chloroflexota bacterium]